VPDKRRSQGRKASAYVGARRTLRWTATILLLAITVSALAGCRSGGGDEGGAEWLPYSTEPVALFPVTVGSAAGFIDQAGAMAIPAQFTAAQPFSEGLAGVQTGPKDKWGYIDKAGTLVIEPQFADVAPFREGRAAVQPDKEGSWGFINTTGALVIPPQYAFAWSFSEGLARVRTDEEGGFIDATGEWVIKMQEYMPVDDFSQGLAPIYQREINSYGFINAGGDIVIAPAYEEAWGFSEDLAAVRTESTEMVPGLFGYIDRGGDWDIAANFENARPFSEGLAAVQIEPLGSWGYIDRSGAVAIPLEWDGAWEFHGGLALVSVLVGSDEDLGPLYGYAYIDTQGRAVWQDAALKAFRAAPPTTTMPEAGTTTIAP
jgi:hypothetical protein